MEVKEKGLYKSGMNPIKATFKEDYFSINSFITPDTSYSFIVTSKPYRKWYKVLLQWLSLGWYKADYYYDVKINDQPNIYKK